VPLIGWARFQGRIVRRVAGGEMRLDHLHAVWHRLQDAPEDERDATAVVGHHDLMKPFAIEPRSAVPFLRATERRGDGVEFGVSALGDDAVDALALAVGRWPGGEWVMGPLVVSGESAGWRLPPSLPDAVGLGTVRHPGTIVWRCETPVSVRQAGGVQLPFPEPRAMYGGLWLRAQRFLGMFGDTPPPEEAVRYPRVSRYRLETVLVDLGRRKIIGALGEVAYDLRHLPPEDAERFQYLASLAEAIGVGHGTPFGFGRVHRLDAAAVGGAARVLP
jgi:hypothetical protein